MRRIYLLIFLLSAGLTSVVISGCRPSPDPIAGPFRPRPPRPPEPAPPQPAPEPEPTDERERILFGRVRQWAESAAERRADERMRRLAPTDEEIEAAIAGQVTGDMSQGVGAWFATVIVAVVKRVLQLIVVGIVTTVIVSLLWAYWPWLAAVGAGLVSVSVALSRLFGRKT